MLCSPMMGPGSDRKPRPPPAAPRDGVEASRSRATRRPERVARISPPPDRWGAASRRRSERDEELLLLACLLGGHGGGKLQQTGGVSRRRRPAANVILAMHVTQRPRPSVSRPHVTHSRNWALSRATS